MWFSDIPYTTCSLSLYVSGSSSVCALSVSFVLSFIPYFIFSALFMLFQVLCMYSITTKHKYLSGDVFLYPVMSSSLSSFTPPLTSLFFFLNVFSCPDSPLSLSLSLPASPSPCLRCDVFQAIPEKPQWDGRPTEQSGDTRSRLQHQGHGQWQLPLQVRPHVHWG